MCNIVKVVKKEIVRLEKIREKVDNFLSSVPEGCLKWQNKKGRIYYYHQIMINGKWERKYIKKENISLAKVLAQKQYYLTIKPIVEKNLNELQRLVKKYQQEELEGIYDNLSNERRNLIIPLQVSVNEKIKQWKEEVYERNNLHFENLRYETEQGELVRSKSEVIIANILYQHRKDILYKYERPLMLLSDGKMKIFYPDFTIINIHTGKIIYWEHAGRMDDPYYANDFVKKINTYIENDIFPGRDVIFSFESLSNPLGIGWVKRLVNEIVIQADMY